MRILLALTYFQPHKSGLTVYAVRQARALVDLGHQVTVLTSQYDRSLPKEELDQGVQIIRLPVLFRLSKGVIMPQMPFKALKLINDSDIVNLHVPQVDAALLAALAKISRKPLVLTYHCDLQMPAGWINQLAGAAAQAANRFSAMIADVIVHNTRDFAENSTFLRKYLNKLAIIYPPIIVEKVTKAQITAFRHKYRINRGQRIIGMVARLATEKGVEYLVQAMPKILETHLDAQVIFVGEYENVFGEQAYKEKLLPMIQKLDDHWLFLGILSEEEKAVFYHLCDVMVLPSINSTESFGMVQIEAMICGTPVISSDLPGVRKPVETTGMGKIVPAKDHQALAAGIIDIFEGDLPEPIKTSAWIESHYSPASVAKLYEEIYLNLLK